MGTDQYRSNFVANEFKIQVNGQEHRVVTRPGRPLLDVLREDLGLTGTKYGCGEGACGACTVLVGGVPTRSCQLTMDSIDSEIETIEGLAPESELHPVQQAFIDQGAMQCGYCVPGQIMTAVGLLREKPQVSRDEIVTTMSEHICRCCNYSRIRAAVEQASQSGAKSR